MKATPSIFTRKDRVVTIVTVPEVMVTPSNYGGTLPIPPIAVTLCEFPERAVKGLDADEFEGRILGEGG